MQKLEFEVSNDINSKVSLCQEDITKLNVDVIVNSVNKTLNGGGGIDGAIQSCRVGLIDECQKLNGCETGECKVTLGCKVPAKYVLYVKFVYCGALSCLIDIPRFDPMETVKMALATVRLWLESNHSSIDHVIFCTFENADYEIYKDLMSNVYFTVSKYHVTNIYLKENSNTDCAVNVRSVEISYKLGQSLPGLQIYPNFAQNNESE